MDYPQRVKNKKKEQSGLDARWQKDEDLYYLKKYVMYDAGNKNKIPDIVNVTLNLPGRFANDVISILGTAKEQSIIETEDKKLDSTEIEDFRRAGFGAANARLKLKGKYELNPWWDFHSCIRGRASALCLFDMVDGFLIPSITPWDTRYVFYEIGDDGLAWGANETIRYKSDIEAEKWAQNNPHVNVAGETAKVLDIWDKEHNEIWLEEEKVFEQEHSYGFTPMVVRSVTLGSMLAGKDSLEHQSEGIFFLIREALPELERLISIMQTLNLLTLKPPIGWASTGGTQTLPEYDSVMRPGSITAHEIGGGVTDINFGDAQRSAQLAYTIMREEIQKATAAAADLGVIESPPASGVRALVAGESRDQLLTPRLGLKAQMNEGLADMFTAQVIQMGGSVELGTPGHKRKFETSKLDGQYEGYYKYIIKSAAVDAGRASLAAAYGDLIPKRAKLVEVLQREDPDGDERQLRYEEAERVFPGIRQFRIAKALDELEEEEELMLASASLGVTIDELLSGKAQQPRPEAEQEPKQVLSLFGGGGQGGAPRIRRPEIEEGEE